MTEPEHDAWWRAQNRPLLEEGHRALAAGDPRRAKLAYYAHIQEELARLHVKGWRLRHTHANPPYRAHHNARLWMIWRTRAEHAAEEAAPPPDAEGGALVEALRTQVTLMRAWAKDEQQKREAAEEARVEARSRAAALENACRDD